MQFNPRITTLVLLASSSAFALAGTLGTSFTYQGKLTDGGAPANGSYDLVFTLYDAASGPGSQIYTSTDSGVNWTSRLDSRDWGGVASSADGTKLVAVMKGGQIYTSTDSGANWTPHENSRKWNGVASSADGTKLVAAVDGGQIYTSTDSGVSWSAHAGNGPWSAVASPSDGTKLVAVAGNLVTYGQIYTSAPETSPGTAGYLTGDQYSAVELLYAGDGEWVPLSYVGNLTPH